MRLNDFGDVSKTKDRSSSDNNALRMRLDEQQDAC